MRVGVIRTDLPSPLRLVDLEPVSQYNPPTEARGQERYLARPTAALVERALANPTYGAGATLQSSNIASSFPITLTGSNNVLRVKLTSAGSFVAVTLPTGTYAGQSALVAGLISALRSAGVLLRAGVGTGSIALESLTFGVNSYLALDTVGNGSTANTILGLTAGVRTMPAASAYITAGNPGTGSLDVSTATLNGVGASTNSTALGLITASRGTTAAVADVLAPMFSDTDAAIDSYLVGMISEYRSAGWNPDPRRIPAISNGAAIKVVEDDGVTAYAATLPTISSATLSGTLTIAGTGLGSAESAQTTVKISGAVRKVLSQAAIVHAGGSVSGTSIVIPAGLLTGVVVTTCTVQVKVRQRASNVRVIA